MEKLTRIHFVADGSYARRIHEYLSCGIESIEYSINWDKLLDYVAAAVERTDGRRCVFTKKTFYIGSNPEYDEENLSFYRSLENAGIQRISFPLRSAQGGYAHGAQGKPALKEDAVDTSLVFGVAKDFFTAKTEDRFDWLVLVAGDGDLAPLVQGLSAEGVRALVIYYDFSTPFGVTRASQGLLEAAAQVISMENLLRERVDPAVKAIFTARERSAGGEREPRRIEAPSVSPSADDIERAIKIMPKKDDGWVLVAQLGKTLEHLMGARLPRGVKLKPLIESCPEKFETKELPAYSVRLRNIKKRVIVQKRKSIEEGNIVIL